MHSSRAAGASKRDFDDSPRKPELQPAKRARLAEEEDVKTEDEDEDVEMEDMRSTEEDDQDEIEAMGDKGPDQSGWKERVSTSLTHEWLCNASGTDYKNLAHS